MMKAWIKLLRCFSLLGLAILVGCQKKSDAKDKIETRPPLELPAVKPNVEKTSNSVLKEELFWKWKIVKLDEWEDGDYIWFTDESTMFSFKCNNMSLFGELTDEGTWQAPDEKFATTEANCQGIEGEQDKALLSLMLGPTHIERMGVGRDTLRFFTNKHEMTIERDWSSTPSQGLSQTELLGEWDVLRFNDFTPKSRLNSEGKRSAYVDFYANRENPNTFGTSLHIGCNYSGNVLRLETQDKAHILRNIPQRFGRVTTQRGCPSGLHQRDDLFFSFMEQAPKIERMGQHRLLLSTDKHELILEKARTRKARNTIRKFDVIKGRWAISMVSKSGLGLGGPLHVPEPIIISQDKIQYGDLKPYLRKPRIQGSKIVGTLTGGFGERDCRLSRSFSLENSSSENTPVATKANAICFVLDTLINQPIAEPINLPNLFQLTSGNYQLTLKRLEE